MFQTYVNLYNLAAQENLEAQNLWNAIPQQAQYSKELLLQAIKGKLAKMNRRTYPFVADFGNNRNWGMDQLIQAIREFVDIRYAEFYGRIDSDQNYQDLIDLAKVIGLYDGQRNYHKYLLGEEVVEESMINLEKLYLMKHSELFAIRRGGQSQFDLIPVADIAKNLNINGSLINFYRPNEPIPIVTLFGHRNSPLHHEYQRLINPAGNINRLTYLALKAFVEVVSNEFDAQHSLHSCWHRPRVAKKEKAFKVMAEVLGTLSPEEREALNKVKMPGSHNTFSKEMEDAGLRDACVSQFADQVTRLLCQCDENIEFTNPRARQVKVQRIDAVRGRILDTSDADRIYLQDLSKVILHTEFKVKIGTKVTNPNDDNESNRVPSHVAEMFKLCQKGLTGEMDPSEARYEAIKVAARCFNNPHNSCLFFLNTRDETSHNFYGMVLNDNFTSIIAENEFLHEHHSFQRGF